MRKLQTTQLTKTIIAIDPDTRKSGVARCDQGVITDVFDLSLIDLAEYFSILDYKKTIVLIENVEHDKAVYSRGTSGAVLAKIGSNVGMVKMQHRNIIEFAKHYRLEVYPVTPLAKVSPYFARAKKDAKFFQQLTGYEGRTNEEKRDAIMIALFAPDRLTELKQYRK